ncbi:MAG: NADH-quinone oxidoreductase subunit K [Candidatus Bathyarchaeota archaeon]
MDLTPVIIVATVLGMAICEHRNLYVSTTCLLVQGILLVSVFYQELSTQSFLLSVISLIIVFPLVIYLTIRKTKSLSEEPFIDGLTSSSILLFLIGVFTVYAFLNFTDPRMLTAIPLFVIGIYTMLAKADLVKLGLGLTLLNNATHTLMLGVEFPVSVEISLVIIKTATIILVMGLALLLYKRTKSLDVRKLMLLRW